MEELDLSPSKDVYKAVKSDVTPISAIKELIDNALDNWERVSEKTDPVTVEILYNSTDDELVIRDNTGGVEEENIQILFALGESKKEAIHGSIGAYGIGAKKAIVNLGDQAIIKSRSKNADNGGYGFRVDQKWLKDEENWTVDKEGFDISRGVTEIRVLDLNISSWANIRNQIYEELQQTYQKFLQPDQETAELTIILDDEEIEPPNPINWSFTPFDGLHPRKYENIKISKEVNQEYDHPVFLHLTVGLLKKGREKEAGTDVYCQNRQVLQAVTDERGGYGDLGNFGAQQRNLKVILEFETEGDADVLPWDTQKNDINPYNPLAQQAFDWVRRAAKPYFKAKPEAVPRGFLRPYGADSEFAANYGEIEELDYQGRKRITQKPDGDYPQVTKVRNQAKTHSFLRIYYTPNLRKWQVAAYELELRRLFQQWYDIDTRSDIQLTTIPDDDFQSFRHTDGSVNLEEAVTTMAVDDVIYYLEGPAPDLEDYSVDDETAEKITSLIEQHSIEGTLYEDLKHWQIPSYLFHFAKHVSQDQELSFSDTIRNPFYPPEEDEPTEDEADIDQSTSEDEDDGTDQSTGSVTQIDFTDSNIAESPSSDSDSETQSNVPTNQSQVAEKDSSTTSTMTATNISKSNRGSTSASSSNPQLQSTSGSPRAETATSKSIKQIVLTISGEQWDQLCDSLGLPSDAPEDQVGRKLIEEQLD